MSMGRLVSTWAASSGSLTSSYLVLVRVRLQCYIGWSRLKKALEPEKMEQYKFTIKPRFMPYLINENLDKDPVTKEKLYSEKFMGQCERDLSRAFSRPVHNWDQQD